MLRGGAEYTRTAAVSLTPFFVCIGWRFGIDSPPFNRTSV
jgi:hypothetical protein